MILTDRYNAFVLGWCVGLLSQVWIDDIGVPLSALLSRTCANQPLDLGPRFTNICHSLDTEHEEYEGAVGGLQGTWKARGTSEGSANTIQLKP